MFANPTVFYTGKWQDVKINEVSENENIPLGVRKSLVGLIVPTIFLKEDLEDQRVMLEIPDNSRLAYAPDVIRVLKSAQKHNEAEQLANTVSNELDMYVVEGGIYEITPHSQFSISDYHIFLFWLRLFR